MYFYGPFEGIFVFVARRDKWKKAEYDLSSSKGGRLWPKRLIDDIPQVQESGHWTAMNRTKARQIVFNRFRVGFLRETKDLGFKIFSLLQLCAKGRTSFVGFRGQLSKLHIFHTTSVRAKLFHHPRDVNLVMIGMFIEFDPKSIDGCYLSDVSLVFVFGFLDFSITQSQHMQLPRCRVHLIIAGFVWV